VEPIHAKRDPWQNTVIYRCLSEVDRLANKPGILLQYYRGIFFFLPLQPVLVLIEKKGDEHNLGAASAHFSSVIL
jgi:hypothetical protein